MSDEVAASGEVSISGCLDQNLTFRAVSNVSLLKDMQPWDTVTEYFA
ncbi:hypothetical protein CLAFUW4_05391 [Fulvia fulva]|nr:uncharacterized protein CLAFUR5_20199 [Fulvia fulva]KAK4623816.1 hypothetical protein CLAFUR4_05385 [Fulvia fulva]KAK4625276.1 hypothetical protein CLAFUR0_05393 [Fulvia fulva]WMI38891.1 hypothetical protein CLAFUR5_20199 [Fulvia fulva]WPV14781.1 hypothetical protein CLAFUW4_05391 [Fulvia fulva]WPV30465.1 hypothetical protein CLAFUW7_05389 [Fulvia fulva]